MLVQSGKPVGVFRTHEWAPRVLLANSNLVGDWATWPEFRRLEQLGLTMYGQMTAGSWIYIGTQGILQGTYETFAAVAAKRFGGTLAGTLTVTAGCGGMGGAQPLAVTMNEGTCLMIDVDPTRLQRRVETPLPRRDRRRPRRCDRAGARVQGDAQGRLGRPGRKRRDGPSRAAAPRCPHRHRHRPDLRARPAVLHPRGHRLRRRARRTPTQDPRSSPSARRRRWPSTSRRWSASWTRAPRSSTTATPSATRPARAATTAPSPSRASSPPTSARSSARARARSAGPRSRGDPKDISTHRQGRPRAVPGQRPPAPLDHVGAGARGLPGPARAHLLARLRRARQGRPSFNDLVARGEVSAPIVIGRDHLDCGSVASPYRESEAMLDGSDAIADWPLLNAMLNISSGASWVSIHHGGGVGIGRSIHAGQVSVADGTPLAGAEAGARADQRPRHGRHPARRCRLRPRPRGRRGARRAHPDAGGRRA